MQERKGIPTRFLFVIHNHQPVGNFDFVFEMATDKAYAPLVDLLAEHPGVRVGLHFTGPLLEWLEDHRTGLLSTVREMCERGQVEILGGGWSEPMLAVLPDEDVLGQLRMMRAECERLFGALPRGMWLAERVWDPDLPRVLKAAEMEYTLLDDTHFRHAGLLEPRLTGHFVTEKAGQAVAVLPIDMDLRYAIPFKQPDEAIATIRAVGGGRTVTYGDDGEKFGIWPETHEWVWEKGWLAQFFERLEDPEQGIELVLPSEQLDRFEAEGRVYLPTASYHEMGEWTLTPEAGRRLLDLKKELGERDLAEAAKPFLHGGIWMGFLAKYPEANTLHKRMLGVSAKVEAASKEGKDEETVERARRSLYRGQCNCPYWHGLFGGLYLPHLRHAVYRQLVEAEALIDGNFEGARVRLADLDGDLRKEVALETAGASIWISPSLGGQLLVLDDRRRKVSLGHVLTRRPETYHADLLEAVLKERESGPSETDSDGPKSIHDSHRSKVPDLEERLVYDSYDRRVLVDHLLPVGAALLSLKSPKYEPLADLGGLRYEVSGMGVDDDGAAWVKLRGHAVISGGEQSLMVTKKLALSAPATLDVTYELQLEGDEPLDATFAVESALALVPGPDEVFGILMERDDEKVERRSPQADGETFTSTARLRALSSLGEANVELTPHPESTTVHFPIDTVSQSEDGAELVYQGTAIVMAWPVSLPPGKGISRSLRLRLL